jgi:hypothetical protein
MGVAAQSQHETADIAYWCYTLFQDGAFYANQRRSKHLIRATQQYK